MKMAFLLTVLALFGCSLNALAKDVQYEFKMTCKPVLEEIQGGSSTNKNSVSNEQAKKNIDRQRKIFSEVKSKLKLFVKDNPNTIWSDDAQNIIAMLSIENINEQTLELEHLIASYPDARMEDWSKKAFYLFLSDKLSVDLSARLGLLINYKQLGKQEKFEKLLDGSLKKYPNNALLMKLKLSRSLN